MKLATRQDLNRILPRGGGTVLACVRCLSVFARNQIADFRICPKCDPAKAVHNRILGKATPP